MEYPQDSATQATQEPPIIRYGREIGKTKSHQPYSKFIWLICETCGKGRWYQLRRELPSLCIVCASRKNMKAYLERRGHPYNWKGGIKKVSHGYMKILYKDHPRADKRGYILEHVAIWEQVHNKSLPNGYVVHHLNGVKSDNRPENLAAFSSRQHQHVLAAKAKRIRELEAKVRLLEKALEANQLIFVGEN